MSFNEKAQVTVEENPQFEIENNQFLKLQTLISGSNEAEKDKIANRALWSLHGGSLEITLTVPLKTFVRIRIISL